MADINNIIDPKLVDELTKMNQQLIAAGSNMDKLIKPMKELADATAKMSKASGTGAEKKKQLTEAEKQSAAIKKQLIATETKIVSLQDEHTQKLIAAKTQYQQNTKSIKDLQRAKDAERGSTNQLMAVNTILEKRLKAVNQATDEGRKKADLLRSAIDKNNTKIKAQSSALTAQKINIGNYGSALGGLSPQLGRVATMTQTVSHAFKLLLANPIVLVISAIVAVFAGLVAVFKSTDSGGTKLQGVFDGISNVLGVLKNALSQVLEAFSLIRQGEFRAAFRAIGDAAKFAADNVMDAYRAGALYADQLDALNDRITANISAQAEQLKNFRENIALSKDQTKTDGERIAALKQAQDAAENYYGTLKKDAQETFDLEVANFASRTKLTAEQLAEFIKLDGVRAEEARKNNKDIANAWNVLGDDTIKSLEEMYSKAFEADTQYAKRTGEIISLRTGLVKKGLVAEAKAKQDAINKQLEIDNLILEDYAKQKEDELLITTDSIDAEVAATIEAGNKVLEEKKRIAEEEKRIEQDKADAIALIAGQIASVVEAFASGQIKSFKELSKQFLLIALDALQKQVLLSSVEILAKQIASKGFAGLATAALLTGAINIAFAGAKGAVQAFAKGTDYAPGGLSLVGEAGRELIQTPSGQVMLANNPALINLERGSKVLTNRQTEAALKDGNILNGLSRVERAIKKMPQPVFKNGTKIAERNGRNWTNYIKSKHRLN